MFVEHTLGIAGRSGGVAKAARISLVPVDPAVIAVVRLQPFVETDVRPGPARRPVEADIFLDRGPLRLHPGDVPVVDSPAVPHGVLRVENHDFRCRLRAE